MKKISICVPTWHRFDLTIKCFEKVLTDERIQEIIINDDASTDGSYERLKEYYESVPKVKVYQNKERKKVHGNKMMSIKKATSDWCILFDSDNIIDSSYIDKIYSLDWDDNVAYQPSFARPHFNYKEIIGVYDKVDLKNKAFLTIFETMLNTQNFFINKNSYLNVWEDWPDVGGADSLFFNYLWLKSGRKINVVEGLEYDHLVHDGSFFISVMSNVRPTIVEVLRKIEFL